MILVGIVYVCVYFCDTCCLFYVSYLFRASQEPGLDWGGVGDEGELGAFHATLYIYFTTSTSIFGNAFCLILVTWLESSTIKSTYFLKSTYFSWGRVHT